jgi:hypothetical protein
MDKPIYCQEVGKRLARHGMPAWRIERVTDELTEHWEDLYCGALERGLSSDEALIEADQRIGKPEQLATAAIAGLRRSTWFGRHPLIAICIVPMILPVLLMVLVALPMLWLDRWLHYTLWVGDGVRPDARLIAVGVWTLYYLATMVSVLWLCHRAWESGLGLNWVLALCSWGALTLLFRYIDADPIGRHLTLGMTFPIRINGHVIILFLFHFLAASRFLIAARAVRRKSSELPLAPCVS